MERDMKTQTDIRRKQTVKSIWKKKKEKKKKEKEKRKKQEEEKNKKNSEKQQRNAKQQHRHKRFFGCTVFYLLGSVSGYMHFFPFYHSLQQGSQCLQCACTVTDRDENFWVEIIYKTIFR